MFRLVVFCFVTFFAAHASASEQIWFGDNASEWANDGECDDRRFFGKGMDEDLNNDDITHDANDCRALYNAGKLQVWREEKARAVTQCTQIDFGNDSSEYANDGECDDPRFEGRGSASDILRGDIKKDANDCRQQCNAGMIFIRNY